MIGSSSLNVIEGPQVFINFRGAELRKTFISHLESALKRIGINSYIDSNESAGENLNKLLDRIEESTVALAVLSSKYTESKWCLKELVKIMERVEQGHLWVIPIFYKLDPGTVKSLDGEFGVQLWNLWRKKYPKRDDRIVKWDAALQGVAGKFGLVSETSRNDAAFVDEIIKHVQNVLSKDLSLRQENPNPQSGTGVKYWVIFPTLFLIICLYLYRVSKKFILPN